MPFSPPLVFPGNGAEKGRFLPPFGGKIILIPLRFHFFGAFWRGASAGGFSPLPEVRTANKSTYHAVFPIRPGERSGGKPCHSSPTMAPRRQGGGHGKPKQEILLFSAGRWKGQTWGHTGGKRRISPSFFLPLLLPRLIPALPRESRPRCWVNRAWAKDESCLLRTVLRKSQCSILSERHVGQRAENLRPIVSPIYVSLPRSLRHMTSLFIVLGCIPPSFAYN